MALVTLLTFLGVVFGAGLVGYFLGRRRVPPSSAPPQDRLLSEQAERIELLETELQRVKDQADFTERLLTERGGAQTDDTLEVDDPG
jgi:hypothetical protein